MALSIKTDPSHAGGGYAVLEGPGLADVTAISVENCASGHFLSEDGRWKKTPFTFPVEATPSGALSLGPHLVDFVPTELLVALHGQDGKELGRLFWADVLPSRNPGAVTSTQVYEERRRRIEATAAEEARQREEAETRRAAEAMAAKRAAEDAAEAERAREKTAAEEAARRDALEREQDEARRRETEQNAKRNEGERERHRPAWGLRIAVGALLLALGAVAAFAFVPELRDLLKSSQPVKEDPKTEQQVETPSAKRQTQKDPPAAKQPPADPQPQVDCAGTFGARLDGLQRLSEARKIALGEEALRQGCGLAAFRAFDVSAWENNEEAAWNLARFYDPNERRAVYRDVGQGHHPDWAAVYYRHWSGSSARQAEALRAICATANSGGASLRRSCAR